MRYVLLSLLLVGIAFSEGFGQGQATLPVKGGAKAQQHFNQNYPMPHNCGSSELEEALMKRFPNLQKAAKDFSNALPALSTMSKGNAKTAPILTIPVVIHVVHLPNEAVGTGQNLSLAQIQSQIDVLNQHFRLNNNNFQGNTPSIFQNAAKDTEIEFCLAVVDPLGNATLGVTRHVYANIPNTDYIEDTIKTQTFWNPGNYLNIWTVPIPGTTALGGTLGYSYLPLAGFAGVNPFDGVVVDYRWFGKGAGVSGLGITAVHEVGHYLGLKHIWGDDLNGVPIGCSSDDGITDTPNQKEPTGFSFAGCPATIPTSCGNKNMYVNYMDYVNDPSCQTMFTLGQSNVMRSVLNGTAGALGLGDRLSLVNNALTACAANCNLTLAATATAASCAISTDGAATVSVSGGTSPFSFLWSTTPLQTSATAINLSAGTYTVTVTDAANCIASATVTVGAAATLGATYAITPVTCAGNDGSITATPSGGTAPYTITWGTNPQPTNVISNLSNGTYLVFITDSVGCSFSENVKMYDICNTSCDTISNFQYGNYSATLYQNPFGSGFVSGTNGFNDKAKAEFFDYNGGNTHILGGYFDFGVAVVGTAGTQVEFVVWDVDANGGVGAELATKSVSLQSIANDVAAQKTTYVGFGSPVAISNGQFFIGFRTPTGSNQLALLTSSIGDVGAGANTGWEQWSDGNWYSYETSWGVDLAHVVSVAMVTPPKAAFAPRNVVGCKATSISFAKGSAVVGNLQWFFQGGVPYFSADPNPVVTYNSVGSYDVMLVVSTGCLSDTLILPSAVTISNCAAGCLLYAELSSTDVKCAGGNDGTAKVVAKNATAPATYAWGTTPLQTTSSIVNLSIGTYAVTVSDANNCTLLGSISIGMPSPLAISTQVTGETCKKNDGSAKALLTGGTPPYSYVWSTAPIQTGKAAGNMKAGNYTLTVTDANGCSAVSFVSVPDVCLGCQLSATTSVTQPTCAGLADGEISVSPVQGVAPYTYLWSGNGAPNTDATLTKIATGSYSVTVTDASNCTAVATFIVPEPDPLTIYEKTADETCAGTDGQAIVLVEGGTPAYAYAWSTTPPQTANGIFGVTAGSYTVTVTDANNCSAVRTLNVSANCPCGATLALSATPETCAGQDGTASVVVTGGNAPFSYLWSNGDTSATSNSLAADNYYVTVTDASGCQTVGVVRVLDNCTCGIALSTTSTGESCVVGNDGTATVYVSGAGQPPYTYLWSAAADSQTTRTAYGLPKGSYTVTVTDAAGCTRTESVTVSGVVSATLTGNNPSCNLNNGSARVIPSGGKAPYTFAWDNTSTTLPQIGGLAAGSYNASVTDADGCEAYGTVVLIQTGSFAVNVTGTDNFCSAGGATAQAITTGGGSAPFTFLWNTGDTTAQVNNLSTGNYTITITDVNGCTAINSTSVSSLALGPKITVASVSSTSCYGKKDGSIDININASSPVSIQWSNGVNAEDIANLSAGAYTVLVIDANGCIASTTVTVTQPAPLTVNGTSTPTVSNTGTASVTPSGGTPPYTYLWSNGKKTQTITNLVPGTFTVTVTDAKGCIATGQVIVQQFTGTLDLATLTAFELFPNPTTGAFTLQLAFSTTEEVHLSIFNTVGVLVYENRTQTDQLTLPIDISENPSGVYFVVVSTENGKAIKRLVLVR